MGLKVAVTGPTGEIGKAFIRALERSREVEQIVGMARREFDPAAHGWKRTEYQQGDVLDRERVAALVKGVDVVVHLAFVIMGAGDESHELNVQGSRNVFEATVTARAKRLVYASSVAAYGFPQLGGELITEDDARARPRPLPLLRAEGRGRGGARRRAHRRQHRRVGLPPVHRRGPRGAAADRQHPLRALGQADARVDPVAVRPGADAQAGAARPGRAVPARAPRRRRHGAARRRPRPRRAGRLQPRRRPAS